MAGPANLVVNILGNAKGLEKALKTAGKNTKGFAKGIKIGAAAGAAAVVGFGAVLVDAVKAAADEEVAVTKLNTAVNRLKGGVKVNKEELDKWITRLAYASTASDDTLRPALGRLVDATGNLKTAQGLLRTSLDLSTASGKPLETVTTAIGKAVNGQKTALLKLFPELAKVNDKTTTGAELVRILAEKYKGADQAANNTAQGGLNTLSEVFGDIQETLGEKLLPKVKEFSDWASSKDGQKSIEDITNLVADLGTALSNLAGFLQDAGDKWEAFDRKVRGATSFDWAFGDTPASGASPIERWTGRDWPGGAPNYRPQSVGGPRPTVIVQTIDPAAACRAVRQALNTDAVRTGRSQIPQGRSAVRTGYYRNGGIV
jgi:hypothetical protein